MKIVNLILGIVCAIAFGGAAMLYSQKSKAVKAGDESLAKVATLEARLTDLQAKHTALTGDRDKVAAASGELADQLKGAETQARQALLDLEREKSQNEGIKLQNDAMEQQLQGLSVALRSKEQEAGQLADARRRLIGNFTKELRSREVQITQLGDSLSLEMVGGILFHSGHAGLSDQGMEMLGRVGEAIKGVAGKQIRIEGHTDSVPIRRRKAMYATNWELSAARATNVVRYLVDQLGVAPERLEAAAMSQYHPVADNGTSEGRAKNRRIVIKLAPMPASAAPAPEQPADE